MHSQGEPWIQSLLVVSGRLPADVSVLYDEHLRRLRERSRQTYDEPETHIVEETSSSDPGMRQVTIGKAMSGPFAVADLCRDEPLWEAAMKPPTIRPPTNRVIDVQGNNIAVGNLPVQLRFHLQCVVCGVEPVSLSFEVVGPHSGHTAPPVIFESASSSLQLMVLDKTGRETLGVGVVQEELAPVLPNEGLYLVVARLNRREASRLPLFVRRV